MLIYIVGLGVIFDLLALRAIMLTVAEKKFRPAVPVVSLICYGMFFLTELVNSLDVENFSNPRLMLAGGLIALHIFLHAVLHLAKKKYG